MAFHEYGGNGSGDVMISLPQWVLEIGKENQDIFFTDREGRRNTECLSWAIDKERVLKGRTGIEVFSSHICMNVNLCLLFSHRQKEKKKIVSDYVWFLENWEKRKKQKKSRKMVFSCLDNTEKGKEVKNKKIRTKEKGRKRGASECVCDMHIFPPHFPK